MFWKIFDIFTRLGFRNWRDSDLDVFATMNADVDVMEFFPKTITREHSTGFMKKLSRKFEEKGYTYFAVETLNTSEWIGFVGLLDQNYEVEFMPCVDIGWRLAKPFWGKGYATEGAKRCLKYGFETLNLEKIYAVAPVINLKSISVIEKIGMQKAGAFIHPKLMDNKRLRDCVYYVIDNKSFTQI